MVVPSRSPALEISDLVMQYGDLVAVDRLSLRLETGTVGAVLGPNGAGKTTTLETCEGYRRPHHGTVRVLGLDPWADRRRLLPRIGVMLQRGGAWSGVRALEMLRHAARLHRDPAPLEPLVERLGLTDLGRTPYRRLSGGQQQRLGLAVALVGRPEVLFVDEPTAGLDPQGRHVVWGLLREQRDAGVTVVLTTHLIEEAEQLADQVFVVDHGRLVASGTPAELTGAHAHGELVFDAKPGLDLTPLRAALPGGFEVVEPTPGHYAVRGTLTPDVLARVMTWCADIGLLPDRLTLGRRTLEDVFLELTGRELRP